LVTYSRSTIVEMIAAYVDGRPIPFSSNSFTNVASVYRGGGSVKCCSERDGAFVTQFNAFIQFLRDSHRPLRRVAQTVIRSLLQLGSRKRRRGVAPLFFLHHFRNLPLRFFQFL